MEKSSSLSKMSTCPNSHILYHVKNDANSPKLIIRDIVKFLFDVKSNKLKSNITVGQVKDAYYLLLNTDKYNEKSIFINELQKKEFIDYWAEHIINFYDMLRSRPHISNGEIIVNPPTKTIRVKEKLVSVSPDFAIISTSGVEAYKFHAKKRQGISERANKPEYLPENNMELFLLSEYASAFKQEDIEAYKKIPNPLTLMSFGGYIFIEADRDKNLHFGDLKKPDLIRVHQTRFNVKKMEEKINNLLEDRKYFKPKSDNSKCFMCDFNHICHPNFNNIPISKVKKEETASHKDNDIEKDIEKLKNVKLTNEQKEIVDFRDGILRVNAAAGSGKTNCLALRTSKMLQEGSNPEDFLIITFTKKSAEEIKERIKGFTNTDVSKLDVSTFNAWGSKIIEKHYDVIFDKKPSLITKPDRLKIISEIIDENPNLKCDSFNYRNPMINFKYAKGAIVLIDNAFQRLKAYSGNLDKLDDIGILKEDNKKNIEQMFAIFEQKMITYAKIDYADQINYVLSLFNIEEIREKYAKKHIVIDEFQDSDAAQIELVKKLKKSSEVDSLVVVGDDSQAIYGFRNTDNKNIINFHKIFKCVKDVYLIANFRSGTKIVELANHINNINTTKIQKEMIPSSNSKRIPLIKQFQTPYDESKYVVSRIKNAVDKQKEMTILTRTKKEAFQYYELLKEEGIPANVTIPNRIIDDTGAVAILKIIDFLQSGRLLSLLHYQIFLRDAVYLKLTKEEMKEKLEKWAEKILIVKESKNSDIELMELFDKLTCNINSTGAKELKKIIKERKFEKFKDLYDFAFEFEHFQSDDTYTTSTGRDTKITVTTVHSAKGKEWEEVIVVLDKFSEGKKKEEREEEMRLLYVAITRARKHLIIVSNATVDNDFYYTLKRESPPIGTLRAKIKRSAKERMKEQEKKRKKDK